MQSNFVLTVSQSLINISLPDKGLSIDSFAMSLDTPYNKSIASMVQSSYNTSTGGTFISSSSSFQTNLSINITHNGDFDQKVDLSHHFPHQQSHLMLIQHHLY